MNAGAAVTVGVRSRHGRIARFKFINVREEEPTMVARLPQQVLLLLVLVTGTSGEAARKTEPRWSTQGARRPSRSTSSARNMRETRLGEKLREATPWSTNTRLTRNLADSLTNDAFDEKDGTSEKSKTWREQLNYDTDMNFSFLDSDVIGSSSSSPEVQTMHTRSDSIQNLNKVSPWRFSKSEDNTRRNEDLSPTTPWSTSTRLTENLTNLYERGDDTRKTKDLSEVARGEEPRRQNRSLPRTSTSDPRLNKKLAETTPWSVQSSSAGTRSVVEFRKRPMKRRDLPEMSSERGDDTGEAKDSTVVASFANPADVAAKKDARTRETRKEDRSLSRTSPGNPRLNTELEEARTRRTGASDAGPRSTPEFLERTTNKSKKKETVVTEKAGKWTRRATEATVQGLSQPESSVIAPPGNVFDVAEKLTAETTEAFISSTKGLTLATRKSRSGHDTVTGPETGSSTEVLSLKNLKNPSTMATRIFPTTRDVGSPRRQMRHVPDVCEKFLVGDEAKREFYSPNYPDPYPNLTECIRVLKADKGMLLKLDFRDEFKLEDSPDCRFDFLEVRDGQHGYSNLLGSFCGTDFPPEITSKTRYLWLRFRSDENIEGKGFKAVWSMVPRPSYPGVPPEPEPCITNVTGTEGIIHSNDVKERKKLAEKEGLSLDCMWIITVKEGWKIQLTFPDRSFKLQRPNECDANFVDIFKERTDMPSRKRNYCGSIADAVIIGASTAYIRFYAEPKALNSSFEAVMTAIREKETGEKTCRENEYDCEDATCIAADLQCNGRLNCRFRWDEDEQTCGKKKSRLIDKQHIVIILVVFSLIMFGMSFAFVFNCVRKLVRDHRIIREHIRQSRENRLDELGRKSTPCPISSSRTDIHDRGSESPSLEVVPSKELLPPTTLIAQEYTKDLVMEMTYGARDMNDIHQSNNVSNATQERLQECSDEPEMRDSSCQTRESLFEPRAPPSPLGFTTFGVRAPSAQNGTSYLHHHRHHHHHHPQPSPQGSQPSSQQSSEHSSQQQNSQCSGCSPASRGRDGSMGVCPKHNPIPAPPGWSTHESSYHQGSPYPEPLDYPSYQRFPSPKREVYAQSGRQATVGSGERYGSSMYGSGHTSSNATSATQHSSTPKQTSRDQQDPRYRAEAVIEVDQRRPFSIESTKSAPDVIATH